MIIVNGRIETTAENIDALKEAKTDSMYSGRL